MNLYRFVTNNDLVFFLYEESENDACLRFYEAEGQSADIDSIVLVSDSINCCDGCESPCIYEDEEDLKYNETIFYNDHDTSG